MWTEVDEQRARAARERNFPTGDLAQVWPTDKATKRWGGTKKGLRAMDTRVHIKNNTEYHGLENHAWQFMATAQYALASDYFYLAASWRRMDSELIASGDEGHRRAESICLKAARYCFDLAFEPRSSGSPEEYGLDETWIESREAEAWATLDAAAATTDW